MQPGSRFEASADVLRALRCALLMTLAVSVAGCERGEQLFKVSGRATCDGVPLREGVVIFRSRTNPGISITANVDGAGQYEVTMARGKGLPAGEYEAWISPPVQDSPVLGPPGMPPPIVDVSKMPTKYRDPKTSEWRLTVGPGENHFDCEMKSSDL